MCGVSRSSISLKSFVMKIYILKHRKTCEDNLVYDAFSLSWFVIFIKKSYKSDFHRVHTIVWQSEMFFFMKISWIDWPTMKTNVTFITKMMFIYVNLTSRKIFLNMPQNNILYPLLLSEKYW